MASLDLSVPLKVPGNFTIFFTWSYTIAVGVKDYWYGPIGKETTKKSKKKKKKGLKLLM